MNFSYEDNFDDYYQKFLNTVEYDGAYSQYYEMTVVKYSDLIDVLPYEVLLAVTIIQSCICAFGYFGNTITCIVIANDKSMHTTTNIYLLNLAVADLIMLSTGLTKFTILGFLYPFSAHMLYGMKGCFICSWLSETAVNVSIITVMAFTIERYLAICRPFLARKILSVSKSVKLIFLIWIIGTAFGYLAGCQQKLKFMMNESMCVYDNTIPYIPEMESLIFFVLPFTIIAVLYILIGKKLVDSSKIQKNQGSSKKQEGDSETQNDGDSIIQIFKMLLTVVVLFFICWAPYHIRRLFGIYQHVWLHSYVQDSMKFILSNVYYIAYFLSSAINPIIYSAMSNKFRNAFKKMFKCWNICKQKQLTTTKHKRKDAVTAV